jgi:hypothetical protein
MHCHVGGHAVEAASPEGIAAQDAPRSEDHTSHHPVRADRILRVMAAARLEPALATEHAGEREPIGSDQADRRSTQGRRQGPQDRAHRHRLTPFMTDLISSATSCDRALAMASRATSTTSRSPSIGRASAHAARSTRRARLRCTAPPTRLPATTASRPLPGRSNTSTRDARCGLQVSRISSISRECTVTRSRRSNGQTRAALAPARREDRATRTCTHTVTEPVHLRAVAVVGLIRALAFGHRMVNLARCVWPAVRRPSEVYGHHRCTQGLTTESASRPPREREVWKTAVLWSPPPSPGHATRSSQSDKNPSPRTGYPPVWKGLVE